MRDPLANLKPLLDEMAARGYLDAFILRHHTTSEVSAHVEGAVSRLADKVARKLGYEARRAIESEAESVTAVVAATLVETAREVVSSDPVTALMDQINGRLRIFPRAVANDVLDLGRKIKVRKLETVAEEDSYEVAAVEEEPCSDNFDLTDLPPEWLAAIRKMQKRGDRMTLSNLAKTLGMSRQYLHRLRSRQRSA
jgi:hypothetical protein